MAELGFRSFEKLHLRYEKNHVLRMQKASHDLRPESKKVAWKKHRDAAGTPQVSAHQRATLGGVSWPGRHMRI